MLLLFSFPSPASSLSLKLCLVDEIKHLKKPNPKTKQNPLDPKLKQNPRNHPGPPHVLVGARSSFDIVCTLPCINVYLGICFPSTWRGGAGRAVAVALLEWCWEFGTRECLCRNTQHPFPFSVTPVSQSALTLFPGVFEGQAFAVCGRQ